MCSVREQELLLDMWRRNRKILGVNDGQKIATREKDEEEFEVGLVLPVYPVSLMTLERLGKLLCAGCILCGSIGAGSNLSRCAQCHAVLYCSHGTFPGTI